MNKFLLVLCSLIISVLFIVSPASAQTNSEPPKQELYKAEVIKIEKEGINTVAGYKNPYQIVQVQFIDGPENGKKIFINHGGRFTIKAEQKVRVNDTVIVTELSNGKQTTYQIIDTYRLDSLRYVLGLFVVVVFLLGKWKGLGALIGMTVSLLVILLFIVPQILTGRDPLLISIIGSLFIMLVTIYLAHGFSKQTTVALVATFISLVLTALLAVFFVDFVSLNGLGSDDAYSLRLGTTNIINFKGLLLGGIIIGALGVLDDITTSLSATIFELHKANPNYKFPHLIKSGLAVGHEHIASLVNTLVLAYAGASLPLFLFVIINPTNQPLWAILNNQLILEEVVRTLAGSMGLILAVPITTLLAAWTVTYKIKK